MSSLIALVASASIGLAWLSILRPTLASTGSRRRAALIGALVVVAWILSFAFAAAVVAAALPAGLLGYVGLLPLLRGLHELTTVRFVPDSGATAPRGATEFDRVWLVVRALGPVAKDGWAMMAALFASATAAEIGAFAVVFTVSCALCVAAGILFRARLGAGERLGRAVSLLRPWACVLVGLVVLAQGGVFNWLWLRR